MQCSFCSSFHGQTLGLEHKSFRKTVQFLLVLGKFLLPVQWLTSVCRKGRIDLYVYRNKKSSELFPNW